MRRRMAAFKSTAVCPWESQRILWRQELYRPAMERRLQGPLHGTVDDI